MRSSDNSILFMSDYKDSMVPSSYDMAVSNKRTCSTDLISQYEYDSYDNSYSIYESNKSAVDIAWEKFWAKNGEQLIWASWIQKYADYINPDYFQNNTHAARDEKSQDRDINEVATEKYFEQNTHFLSETYENVHSNFAGLFDKCNDSNELKSAPTSSLNTNFSFEDTTRQEVYDKETDKDDDKDNGKDENRKKIVNLKISEDNNGWNSSSPFSIEENYERQSNAEDERLLTRCDVTNNSTTKTNAISDSMTNVTKMTLTNSSSNDSNSVHLSNPMNSITSSIESSITSSNSDQENGFPTEDSDKYWQLLWRENFQIEYQKHYELFVTSYKKEHNIEYDESYSSLNESGEDSVIIKQNEVTLHPLDDDVNNELSESDSLQTDVSKTWSKNAEFVQISANKNTKKINICNLKSNKLRTQRLIIDSVGTLITNLQITTNEESKIESCQDTSIYSKYIEYKNVRYVTLSIAGSKI